jgi:Resolvase, N terminal domain
MHENIVIYARFSSHNQNEQSIEGQLKVCYDFAKQNDYNVIHEYIDRAISGTTDKRSKTASKNTSSMFWFTNLTASHEIGLIAQHTKQSSKRMMCV